MKGAVQGAATTTASAPLALCVFAAMGLGLALPFLLLSFSPGLLSRLPRPGAWMEGLRHVLAFPMYGAAAWLAWVFVQQIGAAGLGLLFCAAVALFGYLAYVLAGRSAGTTRHTELSDAAEVAGPAEATA